MFVKRNREGKKGAGGGAGEARGFRRAANLVTRSRDGDTRRPVQRTVGAFVCAGQDGVGGRGRQDAGQGTVSRESLKVAAGGPGRSHKEPHVLTGHPRIPPIGTGRGSTRGDPGTGAEPLGLGQFSKRTVGGESQFPSAGVGVTEQLGEGPEESIGHG